MQRRVAIWILGTFKTSPTKDTEALTGLISIKSHITKLGGRSQLHTMSLPPNHIIWSLMDSPCGSDKHHYLSSLRYFTEWQKTKTKGHLIDANNRSYSVVSSLSPLHPEFSPGSRIIDTFSNWFSFNLSNKGKNNKNRLHQLDSMVIKSSSTTSTAITVTDASIKNNIATAVLHTHIPNRPLFKTHYHSAFVISTEAELFAIRYGINQASLIDNISKIIIVTNSIHAARKIFNILPHPYQIHTTAILEDLHTFFSKNSINSIEFWESPSHLNWHLHKTVDHKLKLSNHTPIFPCKTSWDYSKKTECDDICQNWKMTFQASDGKGRHFLNLLDDNFNEIEPSYAKGGLWLQLFGHWNSLCAWATRAITNHAPIGEYRLRFFPREEFKCLCSHYPIESRRHILHDCSRFNSYWNPRRDSLSHFVMFLKANPLAFTFDDSPLTTSINWPYS